MCITEYDEEKAFAEQKAEGIEIGFEKGRFDTFVELVTGGLLTLQQAAERLQMTVPEFEAKAGLKA